MIRLSDIIEQFLDELIKEQKGAIEIQRNEMADQFQCSPSQINYVLTTRFTSDRGYFIESKRGGGGYIKITRVTMDKKDYLLDILKRRVGNVINKESAFDFIETLIKQNLIDIRLGNTMKAAVDDSTLVRIPKPQRDELRAEILKAVVIAALIS